MITPPRDKHALTDWLQQIRRDLHRIPEAGFGEFKTAAYLSARLRELGIDHRCGVANTGIVAWLGDNADNGCVALRADMDGLPIEERTALDFSSTHPGFMHACGHDGHMTMLLGAAALLIQDSPKGRVVLLFQPAEESHGGATTMIRQGALDGVDAIFSGHIDRHFPVGEFAVEPGLICAYTDQFTIEIHGKGGHAAKPHETVDSIVVASQLVMSIQTLVSRETNPVSPTVISIGRIHGGTAANVIADRTVLEGTIRTTHPKTRQTVIDGLKRMTGAMRDLYNATATLTVAEGYPPIINHLGATRIAADAAAMTVGKDKVMPLPHPSLGGEDFSYYLHKVPGCFVRIGAMKQGLDNAPAHSPFFDFDEAALSIGAHFFAQVSRLALVRINELKPSHLAQKSSQPHTIA